ncbi:MAG: hypothetical protein ACI8UG_001951, partial [Gammaproteobacteria bacterium]
CHLGLVGVQRRSKSLKFCVFVEVDCTPVS